MRIGLYAHGGSGNHGCEAIVRSTIGLLGHHDYTLFSERPEEDIRYGLDRLARVVPSQNAFSGGLGNLIYSVRMKRRKDDSIYWRRLYRDFGKKAEGLDVAFAIGGDNYCYSGFTERFSFLNRALANRHIPMILWGCSIERDRLDNAMLEDLRRYRVIVARERPTFETLKEAGFGEVLMMPDPAFSLETEDTDLPEGFLPGNTVGLNISPLIIRQESVPGAVIRNCKGLVDYVLENSDMNVALIPHVVWKGNDDREPLRQLYDEFHSSGRVLMIDDSDAMKLKGIIRRCRFLVAARTHASIAGYSTGVPTLVLGYSVKSLGIALDLFGTAEHYVLPVDNIREEDELTKSFEWMAYCENDIRDYYKSRLGDYLSGLKTFSLNGGLQLV